MVGFCPVLPCEVLTMDILQTSALMRLPSGLAVTGLPPAILFNFPLPLPPARDAWRGGGLSLSSVRDPACWPCQVGEDCVDQARHLDENPPTAAESRAWFGLEDVVAAGSPGPGLKVCFRVMTVNVQTLSQDPSPGDLWVYWPRGVPVGTMPLPWGEHHCLAGDSHQEVRNLQFPQPYQALLGL